MIKHPVSNLLTLATLGVLALFFLVPLALMVVVSFYKPDTMAFYKVAFVWDNYQKFFSGFYYNVSIRSLWSAGLAAVLVTCIAFPAVLVIADLSRRWQMFWMILMLALMCLSEVIVGFAWMIIFSENAGIPRLLEFLGLWDNPRSLAPSFGAMITGLVTLGFSIVALMLYPQVARRDRSIEEAARTLGTSPFMVFFKVILPTFRTGLIAATMTMFVYLLGVFVIPTMLGKPQNWTMTVMIQDRAVTDFNMPLGAALAVIMLIVTGLILIATMLFARNRSAV
mgnify:CR=1 FL=1